MIIKAKNVLINITKRNVALNTVIYGLLDKQT